MDDAITELKAALDYAGENPDSLTARLLDVIGDAMDEVISICQEEGHPVSVDYGAFAAQANMWAWVNGNKRLPRR